jgi:hypothetical protein
MYKIPFKIPKCICTNSKKLIWFKEYQFNLVTNLGSMFSCTICHNQLINWWKKWFDFVEIKFHLNENIEWHCMHLVQIHWMEFQIN